ncbi:hypothetical protein BDR06DRAFT_1042004 [Suillus hirtellus]|nr:hypothetical protein BDR06DRAFT_1042004 [Suillus hirtellus]
MHIAAINTGDLLLPLWRGTFRAETTDDKSTWAWAKISSGYKAWEWLLYLYGIALATLYGILPEPYWSHFCRLARGLHIMQQYHISRSDLIEGHHHLLNFTDEFEELYYQHWIDQLHFEIRLHNSSVYANLSQHAACHCQVNAIKAIIPTIEPSDNASPKGSLDISQGY